MMLQRLILKCVVMQTKRQHLTSSERECVVANKFKINICYLVNMFCISADDWSRPLVRVRTIVVQVQHPSLVSKLDSRLHNFLYCRLESHCAHCAQLRWFP